MNIYVAGAIMESANKRLKKFNNVRFVDGNFEYRIKYSGGFVHLVDIDRREIGKRNFKYYTCFCGDDCLTIQDIIDKIKVLR